MKKPTKGGLLVNCGVCAAKFLVVIPQNRHLMRAQPFLCGNCHEVNVAVQSARQLEKVRVLPLGRKFRFDRLQHQHQEILSEILHTMFIALKGAVQDEELVKLFKFNPKEVIDLLESFDETLVEIGTPNWDGLVDGLRQVLQDSPDINSLLKGSTANVLLAKTGKSLSVDLSRLNLTSGGMSN